MSIQGVRIRYVFYKFLSKALIFFLEKNVFSFLIANEGSFEYIVKIFSSLVTYVVELIINEEPK